MLRQHSRPSQRPIGDLIRDSWNSPERLEAIADRELINLGGGMTLLASGVEVDRRRP